MNARKAISRADALRMNTISEEQKAAWLSDLDGQLAEMFGIETPKNRFPEDFPLLMPAPHEEIYQLYLICKIDYYNQEYTMYANDLAVYTQALDEARAWYRRTHRPDFDVRLKVM